MPVNLDTILLIGGSLMVVVSIVLNVLSTVRMSRLSETINRLEERVEKKPTAEENARNEGRDSAFDSSILPASDQSDSDSHSTRYRPPGSRAGAAKNPTRTGPGTTRVKKAGMRVPETVVTDPAPAAQSLPVNETVPEPAAEAPAAESAASAQASVFEQAVPEASSETVSEAPAEAPPVSLRLGQEEEALLKSYLGKSSRHYLGTEAQGPETEAAPAGAEDAESRAENGAEGEEEEDVMDVILDTGVYPAAGPSPDYNPFDEKLQKVNLAPVRAMYQSLQPGAQITLDFQDVLFLVEDEYADLLRLSAETAQRGLVLALRNVAPPLHTELSSKIPLLTYL